MMLEADSAIQHPSTLHLAIASILMRHAATLKADNITIDAGLVHMEGEATLDVRGRGLQTGPGAGSLDDENHGMGGSHGGYGGGTNPEGAQNGQCRAYVGIKV